jgi:hypothetical protein
LKSLTAYFAGVATVVGSIAAGFGGALMATDSPRAEAPPTRAEQHLADRAGAASPLQAVVTPASTSPTTGAGEGSNAASVPSIALTQPVAPAPAQSSGSLAVQSDAQPSQSNVPPLPGAATRFHSDFQERRPQDSVAKATDADLRRYIQKRNRRWAKRHFRNNDEGNSPVEIQQDRRDGAPPFGDRLVVHTKPLLGIERDDD